MIVRVRDTQSSVVDLSSFTSRPFGAGFTVDGANATYISIVSNGYEILISSFFKGVFGENFMRDVLRFNFP